MFFFFFGSAEFNHERERIIHSFGDNGLHHSRRRMEIPRAFEEVLDQSSVDLVALPDGRLKVVAEDAINVVLVIFSAEEQEEGVAVLADGGAEVHQPFIHVLASGLHLSYLDGFAARLQGGYLVVGFLPLREM